MAYDSNAAPVHRNPDDFDLPRGEWMCKACAMERTGLGRSQVAFVMREYGVESRRFRCLPGVGKNPGWFYPKDVVLRIQGERNVLRDPRGGARR